MSPRVIALAFSVTAIACSSNTSEVAFADGGSAGVACTPAAQCGGCGSCVEACLCGGGTARRCDRECGTDGKPSAPDDAGIPGEPRADAPLAATFVAASFDIPPGGEFYRCQDFANPFGQDVAVLRSESFMTPGAHHMFLFLKDAATDGDLEPCSGLEFTANVHSTQRSQESIEYPPGVGRFISGGQGFRIQIHYLNASDDTVHTEIAVTLHAAEPEKVPVHASQIFINKAFFSVAPHSESTVTQSCSVPKDVNVFQATSHMHQHGTHFVSRVDDGQLLYETTQWAEPEPWYFDTPRKLSAGTTINVACDFRNDTDQPLGFGESAATNEMCIFSGAYYPAADGESITCLL